MFSMYRGVYAKIIIIIVLHKLQAVVKNKCNRTKNILPKKGLGTHCLKEHYFAFCFLVSLDIDILKVLLI